MTSRSDLRTAALLALALAGLAASAPHAPSAEAAGWTAPVQLVEGDDAALLGAAVKADGTLRTAIEDRPRGIALGLADASADGDAFAPPITALRAPASMGRTEIAADGSGVALQLRGEATPASVVAFDAAGVAQPAQSLPGASGSWTTVAVAASGAAVAAWVTKTPDGHFAVVAAFREAGAAAFGAPTRAGYTTDDDTLVRAGIGDAGEAVVSWQVNGFPSKVAAAVRLPRAAGFGRARFVTRDGTDAQLAVGPGGQAILTTTYGRRLRASIKAPGEPTMPAVREIDAAADGSTAAVAAGGDRRVALAWVARRKGERRARVRVYEGARRPRRVGTVGGSAGGEELEVAVDGSGATAVAWEEGLTATRGKRSSGSAAGVAFRPARGRFAPAVSRGPLSLSMSPKAVRLAPGGRAFVLYEAFESGDAGGNGYRRVMLTERRP